MTIAPTADSDIKVEVWLPISGWNGKFQAVGNGDAAGVISYDAMIEAVRRGYATSSTDTGHVGNTMAFALGHRDKYVDFGYRAVHEMTINAKAIVEAFYGTAPVHSYWNGCSQGGRQGITEAIRYPADFDAIIAGAPAITYMQLHALRLALNRFVHRSGDSYIPPEKYPLIHRAALNACDALDGVTDGLIANPSTCRFDPAVLECRNGDDRSCLTAESGGNGARDVRADHRPRDGARRVGGAAPAGLRARMGPSRRRRTADQRGRAVQVRGVQEPRVGLAGVSFVDRPAACACRSMRDHQPDRCEPARRSSTPAASC